MGLRTLPGIQTSLQDIANKAATTQQAAPDLAGQTRRAVAAGSGSAAALQEASAPQQDEAQAALVGAQQQQTELVRQSAGEAVQALKQQKTELDLKTTREVQGLSEQQANQVQDYRNKAMGILQNLTQQRGQLSLSREKSATEQAGFLIRQSSKSYIDTLQLEGRKSRLDTQMGFKNALIENTFKDEQDLLASNLTFRRALSADQRDFTKWISQMDLDTALQIASASAQASATAGKLSALSTVVSTGARAYSAYEEQKTADAAKAAKPAAPAPTETK